ncbi:tetratricopeptide repeat protein [Gemmata sp. G18]|uniref:Tetratricopeptide repeat protein n=1 Tax=Gemmata palustris TaxID=2822762 RepID=A0ABS5C3D9_9BACT|nr:tetratricopeptide repeat protein [Gemmata palustris]MBP3960487.1 tetratricopeptide repeat protein [Gemmata palustris]
MWFKINWRFLVKLSAVAIVALIAVHFTHRWQVRQQVGAFLRLADAARDAKDGDEKAAEREIAYLKRYVMARPNENDVRERLGRLLCTSAKSGKDMLEGYLVVQDILRRDPARDELRRFAIDFALNRLGLYTEALADVEILLDKRKGDGELKALEARCFVQAKIYDKAKHSYLAAIEVRPDLLDAYTGLAAVLRVELKQAKEADKVVVMLFKNNQENFRAHLLIADYWRTFWGLGQSAFESASLVAAAQKLKEHAEVADAIANAVEVAKRLAPDNLDVILAVSDVSRFRSYKLARSPDKEDRDKAAAAFTEAHGILKAGLVKYPQAPALYLALAARESEQRQEKDPATVIKDGLEAIPDSPPLTQALLGYQILAGDAPGASETLGKLKGRGLTPTQAELYEGRILILRSEWYEAAAALERVRTTTVDNPALEREANLYLGRCYEQLGIKDRRLDAFNRAVPVDTTDALWVPALLGVAEAETALGKTDAALQVYMKLQTQAPGVWLQVARLQMLKALQTPADKNRNWRDTEEALKNAEQILPKSTDVRLLRATLLATQGNAAEARTRLEVLKSERPKDAAVWIALAAQDQHDGKPKQALETLNAAEKEIGDSHTLRLARAKLWVDVKEPELSQKLQTLASDLHKFSPEQQRFLLSGLAELATATVTGPLGGQLWDRVAELRQFDLGVQLTRFDLAVRSGDESKIASVLEKIREIDGEAGSAARLSRALVLIWRAQNKKEPAGLNEADLLLAGLERERSGRARVVFAQALVDDLRGQPSALAKYQKAVEAGETSPDALRRLIELLHAAGRSKEAESYLAKLPKEALANSSMLRLAAELSLPTNKALAITYAERTIPDNSTNPAEYIWQGQIFSRAGDATKAEAAFRKATAVRPDALDGWLVLIEHQTLTQGKKDKNEGERTFDEAKDKVAKAERTLFLALAHTILGKGDKAAEAYKQARVERPTDLRTLQAEADFLFKYAKYDKDGHSTEAVEAYRRVLALSTASPADKDAARQRIVLILASSPNYAVSRQALLELGAAQDDRRSRLMALAFQRDRASRLEAIGMLEADRKGTERGLTPEDQFLLAQLYRMVGDRSQVRLVMSNLLEKNGEVPLYVRFYGSWLLLIGDSRAAEEWVKRLGALQPDAFGTAELQARLAAAKGKGDLAAARNIIVPRADRPGAPVQAVATICESIKLYEDAERLFQRATDRAKEKRPEAPLVLAGFYGRRGRTADALRICDEVRKAVPAATALAGKFAVEALYSNPVSAPADTNRVADWLDEAAKKADAKTKAILVQLLASVRNLQGNYAEAMRLYRDAIDTNKDDVLALNNLAFLVSAQEKNHDEALRLIKRAQGAGGTLPELLDTEALILLQKKDFGAARRLLETVTVEDPSGTAYYHLAQVELAAGDRKLEAKRAWQQAEDFGIKLADLHPLERAEFERVSALLK